jgi:hypothetical protein
MVSDDPADNDRGVLYKDRNRGATTRFSLDYYGI